MLTVRRAAPALLRAALCAASLGCAVGAVWVRRARADEASASNKALAEALFRNGRRLMAEHRVADACDKFAESQRLEPKIGTLLNLALCHEAQGKIASAWAEYSEVATQATRAAQMDRAAFARQRARELEGKIPRLVIEAPPDADLQVELDEHPLAPSALGTALPIDPGAHRIRATARGKQSYVEELSVELGQPPRTIRIAPLLSEPKAAEPAQSTKAATPRAPLPARHDEKGEPATGLRFAGLVAGGLGLVGIGFGAAFGIRTLAVEKDADSMCPDRGCTTQEGIDRHDEAARAATISTIALAAGGVGIGVGVVLLVASRSRGAPSALWLVPGADPVGRAGLRLGSSF